MLPRLRWILPCISLVMLLASLAALAWAVLAPCQVSGPGVSAPVRPTSRPPAAPSSQELPQESSGEKTRALAQRRFQRPLFDPPPPPPPVVEKKPPPTVSVKLLATMPEPNGGRAMFADAQGTITIKSLGEDVAASSGRAQLTEITNDHVLFRCEDATITLTLGKE